MQSNENPRALIWSASSLGDEWFYVIKFRSAELNLHRKKIR